MSVSEYWVAPVKPGDDSVLEREHVNARGLDAFSGNATLV